MISIILNRYDQTKVQNHMTIACLGEIRRFTDPTYEIIVVDNEPKFRLRDDYGVIGKYIHLICDPKLTVYGAYNLGFKYANYNKLMFIQNDVFVHERAINRLAEYLDKYDVAFPQQIALKRKDVKKINKLKDGKEAHVGWRDAGLIAMTRGAFNAVGGWDERFHNLLGEKALYQRIADNNLSWTDHTNAFVTHIAAATNLAKDEKLYNEEMDHDSSLVG